MTMLTTLLLAAARPALYLPIGLGCRVELPTDGVAREPWKAEQGRLVMSPPRYPGPGYSMPWVSLTEGEVCRYWQAATLDRAPLGFRIAYDPATSNVDVTADRPIIAETLSGGWHAAARRYRAAWDRQFRLARQTEAVRTMSGFLLVILKQQNGEVIWPYGDFAELAERCVERGLDWVGLFGWTRGGHDNRYPDYEPDPAQGGREALAAGIDLLHRRGLKVFLYANGQLQERGTTDYWKTVGKDARLVDPKGAPQGETWHKYSDAPAHHFDYACLSMPCWHEAMRRVARLSAELGADGLLYDQLGTTAPRRCFATGHRHAPGDWVYAADRVELMEDVLKEARQVKDDFLILTEGLHDSLLSSVAAYHGWAKGTFPVQGISFLGANPPELDYPPYPFIFQYAFPELVCTVRIPTPLEPRAWANYAVLTGLRHELEIRYAPDRLYARDGRRPDLADYGTIREKPAIGEMCREDAAGSVRYLKALTALQRRFADVFYGGRFTDDEGFSCEAPAGIVAKSFTGARRRVVVVCNFTSRAATVRIRSGDRLIGAYEPEREEPVPPGEKLAPDALRLYVFDVGDDVKLTNKLFRQVRTNDCVCRSHLIN